MKFQVNLETVKESNEKAKEFRSELGLNNQGNNLLDTLCKVITDAELVNVDLTETTVKNWLTFLNFSNYFSNEIPDEIYSTLDYGKFLPWVEKMKKDGKLESKNKNLAVNERFATWQKRRTPYFKSHVIGTSDKASLSHADAIASKRYAYKVDYNKKTSTIKFVEHA